MENKTERIVLRLTPSEKKAIKQEAKEKNTTLSLLIRQKIFK